MKSLVHNVRTGIVAITISILTFVVIHDVVAAVSRNLPFAKVLGFLVAALLVWITLALLDDFKAAIKPFLITTPVVVVTLIGTAFILYFFPSFIALAGIFTWCALGVITGSFWHVIPSPPKSAPDPSVTGEVNMDLTPALAAKPLEFAWGKYLVPFPKQALHYLFLGNTGTGKSVKIFQLLQSVTGAIGILPKWGALILDAKRDMPPRLDALRVKYYILNPLDRRSVAWDVGREIIGPFRAKQFAVGIIIEDGLDRGHNKFFYDVAVILLANIIEALQYAFGTDWTLLDLVRVCASSEAMERFLKAHHPNFEMVADYFKAGKRDKNDAVLTVKSRVDLLVPIAAIWQHRPKIALTEILDGKAVGLLGVDEEASETVAVANSIITRFLMGRLQSLPDDPERRFWLILDELPKAGTIHRDLESFMAIGRSKGLVAVLGLQDIAQGIETFGEKPLTSIFGLARFHAYCGMDDASAQWVSQQYGQFEVPLKSKTISIGENFTLSTSVNHSTGQRPVLPPHLLSDRKYSTDEGLWAVFRTPERDLHQHFDSWDHLNQFSVEPTSTSGYQRFEPTDPRLRLPVMTDCDRRRLCYPLPDEQRDPDNQLPQLQKYRSKLSQRKQSNNAKPTHKTFSLKPKKTEKP